MCCGRKAAKPKSRPRRTVIKKGDKKIIKGLK
jgi:hypothetical protein